MCLHTCSDIDWISLLFQQLVERNIESRLKGMHSNPPTQSHTILGPPYLQQWQLIHYIWQFPTPKKKQHRRIITRKLSPLFLFIAIILSRVSAVHRSDYTRLINLWSTPDVTNLCLSQLFFRCIWVQAKNLFRSQAMQNCRSICNACNLLFLFVFCLHFQWCWNQILPPLLRLHQLAARMFYTNECWCADKLEVSLESVSCPEDW